MVKKVLKLGFGKEIFNMWDSKKSVQLSVICTRIVIVLLVVCAVVLPKVMNYYSKYSLLMEDEEIKVFMLIMYVCCIPAMFALFCLDRLLASIKKDEIFIEKNVGYLRKISWCCFLVAGLLLVAGKYYFLFLAVAVVTAFIGLILRVVKNVIEKASLIKAENDFTI